MRFNPQPKPGRKLKKRRKAIAAKSKFLTYENLTKNYKYPDPHFVRECAAECRDKQLKNRTDADIELEVMLLAMGATTRPQVIFYRPSDITPIRYIVVDLLATKNGKTICVESDGEQHKKCKGYDKGRDAWLLAKHNIPTIRFWAKQVFKYPEYIRERLEQAFA